MLKSVLTIAAVLGGIIIGISGRATSGRPSFVECQSSLECMPGNCCTISPNKFSVPQCRPMQEAGGVCRPNGHATLNTTLVYPDGSQVQLTDVHFIFCPCTYGLSCDREEGVCRDASETRGFNHLLGEASTQDD